MSEQTVSTDKRFLNLLTPFLPKDFIRYSVWAVSRVYRGRTDKLYRQCLLADELIDHYQPVYQFTHTDKQVILAGTLLSDAGKVFSDTRYALIGYGLTYEYIQRSAPDAFNADALEQIARCVYDTRPRRQPAGSIQSQLVYLANQGVPSPATLAAPIIKTVLRSGIIDEADIVRQTREQLSHQYGDDGIYWSSYPDMGKQYFFDEWEATLDQINDGDFLLNLLHRIQRRHDERQTRPGPDESIPV